MSLRDWFRSPFAEILHYQCEIATLKEKNKRLRKDIDLLYDRLHELHIRNAQLKSDMDRYIKRDFIEGKLVIRYDTTDLRGYDPEHYEKKLY